MIVMRKKVLPALRAKPLPVSLYPQQKKFIQKRSGAAGTSVSRYVQALIAWDMKHGIAEAALKELA